MRPDYRGFIVASATNPKQIAEDDSVPQFKMATVTSVSPLRVRYDNELSASPATPRNLVGTLAIGDRVRVTLHRRKTAIDGRIGGTTNPGPITNLVTLPDADTLVATGVYVGTGSQADNWPSDTTARQMLVEAWNAGNHIAQRVQLLGGGMQTYARRGWPATAPTWSAWRLYDPDDPVDPVVAGIVSSKTWYQKNADGTLWCRGSHSFPASANNVQTYAWTFPVAFVGENPMICVTPDTTVPQNVTMSYNGLSLTSVTINFLRTTASDTGTQFEARGRWK